MRLDELAVRALWSRVTKVQSRGFDIGIVDDTERAALLRRLEAALDALDATDASCLDDIRDAMPRILIRSIPLHLARYYESLQLCEIRAEFIGHGSTSPQRLMLTIVHEGTHARIRARGLHKRGLSLLREERLAARAELAVALKIAGGEKFVAYAERRLADVTRDYSPEERIRGELLSARALGAPLWLVHLLAKFRGVRLDLERWHDPYSRPKREQ